MKMADYQKIMVVLLATASLGTTALIALNVASQKSRQAHQGDTPFLVGQALIEGNQQDPPVLIQVPEFSLIERTGEPFGSEQLAGKVWIAQFIFTQCHGPCPMMTSQMAQLQMALQDHPRWGDIRLVSISVDPDNDTPKVLREYARIAHADPQQWLFLTGTRSEVWSLIQNGFKLPVGEDASNEQMPIFHSQKFLLIDGQNRIRGLYDGLESDGRAELRDDLEKVLAEG